MNETVHATRLFGANILHSVTESAQKPPEVSAFETFQLFDQQGDEEACEAMLQCAFDISCFIEITLENGNNGVEALMMQFTPSQLQRMHDRVTRYLEMDIPTFLSDPVPPQGYPVYIERLGSYFSGADSLVTSQFSSFYDRHVDPSAGAVGPREINSRIYACEALRILERQLAEHYQVPFTYTRSGPYKENSGMIDWEPGVAECQFLILDAVRDLLASDITSPRTHTESISMTVPDIGSNIHELLVNKGTVVEQVAAVNPDIARQVEFAIDGLRDHVKEVYHRGRPGVPSYTRRPDNARRAILRVEELLLAARRQSDMEVDQEEIPVLDI